MFLNDSPIHEIERDKLRFEPLVNALHGVLLDKGITSHSAFTIGIFADWGMGKSSLMRLLKGRLDLFPNRFVTLEFNAWRFEEEERLFAPLILMLSSVIPEDSDALKRAIRIASDTLKGMVNIAIARYTEGILTLREINRVARYLSGRREVNEIRRYMDDIERLIQAATRGGRKKLVVFIDDIERCNPPEKGVELLEDLKLLMDMPQVAFVIGADRKAFEGVVSSFYGDKINARRYLEKFVQLPIYLPPHQTSRVAEIPIGDETAQEINAPPEVEELRFKKSDFYIPINMLHDTGTLFVRLFKHIGRMLTHPIGHHRKLKPLITLLRRIEKYADMQEDTAPADDSALLKALRYLTSELRRAFRMRHERISRAEEFNQDMEKLIRTLRKKRRWLRRHNLKNVDEIIEYLEGATQNLGKRLSEQQKAAIENHLISIAECVSRHVKEHLRDKKHPLMRDIRALRNNPRRFKRLWNMLHFYLMVFVLRGDNTSSDAEIDDRIEKLKAMLESSERDCKENLSNVALDRLTKLLGIIGILPEVTELNHIDDVFYIEQRVEELSESARSSKSIYLNLVEELKSRLQDWKVPLDDEDLMELIFLLETTKSIKFDGLEMVMEYMFPHESGDKTVDLLAQVIERNSLLGKKYIDWKFNRFLDLSHRALDYGFFEGWKFERGADFTGATAVNGVFRKIQIGPNGTIDFTDAVLMNADFTGANFNPEVIFNGADLRDAKFVGASFGKVSFTDADVEGADFTGISMGGYCLNLHTARNWDRIIIDDENTWDRIIQNYKNAINCEGDQQTIDKFLMFCHAKMALMKGKK